MDQRFQLTLLLDDEMLKKVGGYYIYRSMEEKNGKPIIDGVYVRRDAVDGDPPEAMSLLLEW